VGDRSCIGYCVDHGDDTVCVHADIIYCGCLLLLTVLARAHIYHTDTHRHRHRHTQPLLFVGFILTVIRLF